MSFNAAPTHPPPNKTPKLLGKSVVEAENENPEGKFFCWILGNSPITASLVQGWCKSQANILVSICFSEVDYEDTCPRFRSALLT